MRGDGVKSKLRGLTRRRTDQLLLSNHVKVDEDLALMVIINERYIDIKKIALKHQITIDGTNEGRSRPNVFFPF